MHVSDIERSLIVGVVDLWVLKLRLSRISTVAHLYDGLEVLVQLRSLLALSFVQEHVPYGALQDSALGFPNSIVLLAREADQKLGVFTGPGTHHYVLATVDNGIANIIGFEDLVILPRSKRAVFHIEFTERDLTPAGTALDSFPLAIGPDTRVFDIDQVILSQCQLRNHTIACLSGSC